MKPIVKSLALAAIGAIAIGTAAQAADLGFPFAPDRHGPYEVGFGGGPGAYRFVDAPGEYDERDEDRYGARPAPDRPHWAGGDWARPVAGRPHWAQEGCRLIVKRRENAWGDVTVTRIRRCD